MPHTYYVDIVGTCNLRCRSCPTGNFRKSDFSADRKPLGFMTLDLFDAILSKIVAERGNAVTPVHLYNWGEPLLHPRAAEFVERVSKQPTLRCGISSNLSLRIDLDRVIAAAPHWMRISVSGFYQDTYAQSHRKGDIELVKTNMRGLRAALDKHASKCIVDVSYHIYRHNCGADFDAMMQFAADLGFNFKPIWASFYPLEKLMSGKLSDDDRRVIELLAIKPHEMLAAAQPYKNEACRLQDNQTSINFDGTVQLCCATFDPAFTIAKNYLDVTQDDLMAAKRNNDTCTRCIAAGYHAMMLYRVGSEADTVGNERIAAAGARFAYSIADGVKYGALQNT
jgi:MoaA/NifB/PqqE/SkfB family radical SAM enzyme